MKTKTRFKNFDDAKSTLELLGFKQETPFVETSQSGGIVRFISDRYFAFVHKEKTSNPKKQRYQIYYFEKDDMEISVGPKGKPGPKPSGDAKQRIVIYVKKSVIEKLGGADATRNYLYANIDSLVSGKDGLNIVNTQSETPETIDNK